MELQKLKSVASVMASNPAPSANDLDIWSMVATTTQIEELIRKIQALHQELGLAFDALSYMAAFAAQATAQQVLDLIGEIETLEAQKDGY